MVHYFSRLAGMWVYEPQTTLQVARERCRRLPQNERASKCAVLEAFSGLDHDCPNTGARPSSLALSGGREGDFGCRFRDFMNKPNVYQGDNYIYISKDNTAWTRFDGADAASPSLAEWSVIDTASGPRARGFCDTSFVTPADWE